MPRLTTSVGEAGGGHRMNARGDVKYAQYLLADWQLQKRQKALVVDGVIGPLTLAAIRTFQSQNTSVVDGRIDPAGPTIGKLEHNHLSHIVSGMHSTEYLSIRSMTTPPPATIDLQVSMRRYLDALRQRFG